MGGEKAGFETVGFKTVGFKTVDLDRIRQATGVVSLEYHPQLPSTNTRALAWAEGDSLTLPALVLTDLQTAGRGRGDHRWWAAPGALTFSLIVPGLADREGTPWSRIALTAGLAVGHALQQLQPGLPVGLKWPNDVYVSGRKICGILVEVPPRRNDRLVVGMGLNVNNSMQQAPPEVANSAISLRDLAGYSFPLPTVLIRVLCQFLGHFEALKQGDLAAADRSLASQWHEWCMLTGLRVRVETGRRVVEGTCTGIADSGALLLDTPQGQEQCLSGTVTVI
jgi:BirA family biotin operon repressor/biotin-[acetyl-CoA-carboxylase] ligase